MNFFYIVLSLTLLSPLTIYYHLRKTTAEKKCLTYSGIERALKIYCIK